MSAESDLETAIDNFNISTVPCSSWRDIATLNEHLCARPYELTLAILILKGVPTAGYRQRGHETQIGLLLAKPKANSHKHRSRVPMKWRFYTGVP
jgi:hypothetical protein